MTSTLHGIPIENYHGAAIVRLTAEQAVAARKWTGEARWLDMQRAAAQDDDTVRRVFPFPRTDPLAPTMLALDGNVFITRRHRLDTVGMDAHE